MNVIGQREMRGRNEKGNISIIFPSDLGLKEVEWGCQKGESEDEQSFQRKNQLEGKTSFFKDLVSRLQQNLESQDWVSKCILQTVNFKTDLSYTKIQVDLYIKGTWPGLRKKKLKMHLQNGCHSAFQMWQIISQH